PKPHLHANARTHSDQYDPGDPHTALNRYANPNPYLDLLSYSNLQPHPDPTPLPYTTPFRSRDRHANPHCDPYRNRDRHAEPDDHARIDTRLHPSHHANTDSVLNRYTNRNPYLDLHSNSDR